MFRIDTPELPEREYVLTAPEYIAHAWQPAGATVKRPSSPARSRLVSPGALYAINPCTEEAARTALERSVHRPLILISAPPKAIQPVQVRDFECCTGNPEEGHDPNCDYFEADDIDDSDLVEDEVAESNLQNEAK
jgi:hypothetical protein